MNDDESNIDWKPVRLQFTEAERLGYAMAKGACKYLAGCLLIGLALLWVWGSICDYFNVGVDDSDLNGYVRSGLTIHTDHKTGIQYVSRSGALTPRLTKEGQQ